MAVYTTPARPILPLSTQFFLFDLETVDLDPTESRLDPTRHRVWDIAVVHVATRQSFSAKIDPGYSEYPARPGFFTVTPAYLKKVDAKPFAEVASSLVGFLWRLSAGSTVPTVLVSHGNFVLDKPVLEQGFRRAGLTFPRNVLFFDTCPFFRKTFRNRTSYSLRALYTNIIGCKPRGDAHRALADVHALEDLLMWITNGNRCLSLFLHGGYYPPYCTPLQCIRGIGNEKEALLWSGGLRSVEDLILLLMQGNLQPRKLCEYMVQWCHVDHESARRIAANVLRVALRP